MLEVRWVGLRASEAEGIHISRDGSSKKRTEAVENGLIVVSCQPASGDGGMGGRVLDDVSQT